MTAPVMFISHGAPLFALEPGEAGSKLQARSELFDGLQALLVISPHWHTRGSAISAHPQPATLHDFGGFPEALYRLHYPASGAPDVAASIQAQLASQGYTLTLDHQRGLDHGAWVPLMHLRPQADIPVLQLSLDATLGPRDLLQLGQALAPLRDQGIAVLTSGGVTHNLSDMKLDNQPTAYAERFQNWLRQQVKGRQRDALLAPADHSPDYNRAHPSAEHYLPLLIALGATSERDQLEVLTSPILYRAISMESYLWTAQ